MELNAVKRGGWGARKLYYALRRAVLEGHPENGQDVYVKVMKHWVAFRSKKKGKAFAEVRLGKRHLEVFILPPAEELEDPSGLTSNVPPSRGWGWFCSRFRVTRLDAVEGALKLLWQSYESA
jgi:predicted transport protein